MTRQTAEQVIAGVVLSEQLASSAYGALYRAQWRGERNLRGLVIHPNLMASELFHVSLTDPSAMERVVRLSGPHLVPTIAVESAGRSAVVVTRGHGRCTSIVDLLTEGRSRDAGEVKFTIPIAGAIARSVAEALTDAHEAGVIHGAVHPRSVWIGQDGVVKLDDFVVVDALRRAAAYGDLASVWRGLSEYVAPEIAAGQPPTASGDLFAVGALMFALLTGEPPPGAVYATPGIERFLRRAIDVDPQRRYQSATELLEHLQEAMEDDRWQFAEPSELCARAGLTALRGDVDDATEDLLASLADAPASPQPRRPRSSSTGGGLDSLLGELGDRADSVGGFDDMDAADDHTHVSKMQPVVADDPFDAVVPQPHLATPASSADDSVAHVPREALDQPRRSLPREDAGDMDVAELSPRLTSRVPGVIGLIAIALVGYFIYHQYTNQQQLDAEAKQRAIENQQAADEKQRQAIEDLPDPGAIRVMSNPPQAGVWLKIGRTPVKSFQLSSAMMHELRLEGVDGHDPVDTQVVAAHWNRTAEQRTAAIAVTLPRAKIDARTGKPVPVVLPPMPPKPPSTRESDYAPGRGAIDPSPHSLAGSAAHPGGAGVIEITSTPAGAEVWMYIGMTNNVELRGIRAGLPYELRLLSTGYRPGFISVAADEWRSGGDLAAPIDRAKKLAILEKSIDLVPDPAAVAQKKPSKGR